jgi:two-component system sensor histidine kinase TctE
VAARPPDDLRPVRSTAIPADVRPLVEAINQHIERHREISRARRAVSSTTPRTSCARR